MEKNIDIFNYTQFRKYLAEAQEFRFQIDPSFTRVEICNQLGLPNTRSYFSDILRGKKLSARMVERLASVFGMSKKQSQYFNAMVQLDQAKNDLARTVAMETLLSIHPNPQLVLDSDAYEYYAKWYHSTIFSILDALDISDNTEMIAKRIFPKISIKKIDNSIELLNRLGIIRKNIDGFWKPTQDRISSGRYNNDELVKQYQLQCFELSKQALISPNEDEQIMSTMAFSISGKTYTKVEKEIQSFKQKIRQLIATDKYEADHVYHLNLHCFSNLKSEEK